MSHPEGLDFLVKRSEWSDHKFVRPGPPGELAKGQVRFRVDRFAFTANNISYAMAGDMLRYWDFFPPEDGDKTWGRIPVMGFGDVIQSRHDGVIEGTRCFGFFPMSRYLVIEPSKASRESIFDGASHRDGIAPAYNTYSPVEADPSYDAAHEDRQALMRGLFMTSFLVDDFLAEQEYCGAENIIILSASSKTAIALAFLAKKAGRLGVIGVTSPANHAFVKGLDYYDEILHYDDVEAIASDKPSVLVDMSGDGPVLGRIHRHLGNHLKHSCIVGATHWNAGPREEGLPGPAPEFFFAPGQIQKRAADWGPAGLQQRIGESWSSFRDSSVAWLTVEHGAGSDEVARVFLETLEGKARPDRGHILSLQE